MGIQDGIGNAAGKAFAGALASNPDLVEKIISAAIKALIENLPALIDGIQTAIAHAKAKEAVSSPK